MRTLQSIRNDWAWLLTLDLSDFHVGTPMRQDEEEETRTLFSMIRIEEADGLDLDATAWQREMTPLEKDSIFLMVRQHRSFLAVLQELIDELLPSDEYADANLAFPLIRAITFPLTRVNVLSGFIINLAKAGQKGRARGFVSMEFDSPFVRFQTILALAKITGEPVDWSAAHIMADYLLVSPKVKRKRLAKVRAYLAIYLATHNKMDLFVARETAIDDELVLTESAFAKERIDPEEATLANMDIYSATHDPDDLEKVRKYLMMVTDLGRRAALMSALDHLD
jgi:hypothetical protein